MSRNAARRHTPSTKQSRSQARSIRFNSDEIIRIEQAAKAKGLRPSDFIRHAINQQCDEVLAEKPSLLDQMADLIGIVDVPLPLSEKTGQGFTDLLLEQQKKPRKL